MRTRHATSWAETGMDACATGRRRKGREVAARLRRGTASETSDSTLDDEEVNQGADEREP